MPPKRRIHPTFVGHLSADHPKGNVGTSRYAKEMHKLRKDLEGEIEKREGCNLQLKAFAATVAELQDKIDDASCSSCDDEGNAARIAELEEEVAELETKAEKLETQVGDLEDERDFYKGEAKEWEENHDEVVQKLEAAEEEARGQDRAEEEVEKVNGQLVDLVDDLLLIADEEDADESRAIAHKVLKRLKKEGFSRVLEDAGYVES